MHSIVCDTGIFARCTFFVEWNTRVRLLLAVFFCFGFLVQFFVDVLVQNRFLFGQFFIGYIFVSGFFQQLSSSLDFFSAAVASAASLASSSALAARSASSAAIIASVFNLTSR